mmetsp:Transcript_86840/g.250863  ORF Transcript_86840/g.250863 Transcript_86840/m.250863 type:complete len:231 (+) Transcript_86840:153-845(+)
MAVPPRPRLPLHTCDPQRRGRPRGAHRRRLEDRAEDFPRGLRHHDRRDEVASDVHAAPGAGARHARDQQTRKRSVHERFEDGQLFPEPPRAASAVASPRYRQPHRRVQLTDAHLLGHGGLRAAQPLLQALPPGLPSQGVHEAADLACRLADVDGTGLLRGLPLAYRRQHLPPRHQAGECVYSRICERPRGREAVRLRALHVADAGRGLQACLWHGALRGAGDAVCGSKWL